MAISADVPTGVLFFVTFILPCLITGGASSIPKQGSPRGVPTAGGPVVATVGDAWIYTCVIVMIRRSFTSGVGNVSVFLWALSEWLLFSNMMPCSSAVFFVLS